MPAAAYDKPYKIKEEAHVALRDLLVRAQGKFQEVMEPVDDLIADVYTGRDPGGVSLDSGALMSNLVAAGDDGIDIRAIPDPTRTTSWQPPQTTANLFLSRLRLLLSAAVPARPSFMVKPRNGRAARLAERQNRILDFLTDHGDLFSAMREAAFRGFLAPHFGVKFIPNKKGRDATEKIRYEALRPSAFGWEPHYRRFSWHTYDISWGDFENRDRVKFDDPSQKPADWEMIRVTEVYHEGFRFGSQMTGHSPMSVFVNPKPSSAVDKQKESTKEDLGNYVYTANLRAVPISFGSYLPAAPNEDIPPPEAHSAIPLIRMIVQLLVQIDTEIKRTNKIVLYDNEAIKDPFIKAIIEANPGATIYVGVDTDSASERGVNATMRPMERDSVLGDYLAVLPTYMAILDDVMGLGPQERGLAEPPRKSATEAQAISASSSKLNRQRLVVIARVFADIARVTFEWQRHLLGKMLELPTSAPDTFEPVEVPSPEQARFTFQVDPVELENLTRRGEIEAKTTFMQLAGQQLANFGGGLPKMMKELLRQLGHSLGVVDVDLYLDMPDLEAGPQDRYIEYLEDSRRGLPVYPTDQPALFISYYTATLERLIANPRASDRAQISEIEAALSKYQQMKARADQAAIARAAEGNPGAIVNDNVAAPALAAGQAPGVPATGKLV